MDGFPFLPELSLPDIPLHRILEAEMARLAAQRQFAQTPLRGGKESAREVPRVEGRNPLNPASRQASRRSGSLSLAKGENPQGAGRPEAVLSRSEPISSFKKEVINVSR